MTGWHVKKLKDNCLDVIKKNIDHFVLAFESGENIPKHHVEYLQASSSEILLDAVEEREDLSLTHAKFFINPYLKQLHLNYFLPDDINAIIEVLKSTENNIHRLSIMGQHYSEEMILELVDSLPQSVTSLLLCDTRCSNETLRRLAKKCPSLQSLDVCGCPNVNDAGLEALCRTNGDECKNTTLQKLEIDNTSITRSGIAFALKHFCNLNELEHDFLSDVIYEIHAENFLNRRFSSIDRYNLTELSIDRSNHPFEDTIRICSISCPHVTTLYVHGICTESELSALTGFEKLKIIQLSFEEPVSILLFLEKKKSDLEELEVINGSVSLEQIIKFCPKLQDLRLKHTKVEQTKVPSHCDFQNALPDLKVLTATNVDFDIIAESASLIFLSSPNIERLDFSSACSFTDEFARALTKYRFMSTLHELYIRDTDVTLSGVRELLAAAPNLAELDIDNTNITSEEYDSLTMTGNCLKIWWSPKNV